MKDALSKREGILLSSLWIVLIIHVMPFLVEFLFVLEVSLKVNPHFPALVFDRVLGAIIFKFRN